MNECPMRMYNNHKKDNKMGEREEEERESH